MATKTGIIASINGYLTSIITIVKHRNSMLDIINEMYRETTSESYTNLVDNTPLTTPNGTTRHYSFKVDKIGNKVFFDGTLTNKTGNAANNLIYLTITDAEFLQNSDIVNFYGVNITTNTLVRGILASNILKIVQSVGINETVQFNLKYTTNN
jgi:hypothetical protein